MKNTKVTLIPLTADDREQFILDNQWAFKYGAIEEFGKRDDHLDFDGEIESVSVHQKAAYNVYKAVCGAYRFISLFDPLYF